MTMINSGGDPSPEDKNPPQESAELPAGSSQTGHDDTHELEEISFVYQRIETNSPSPDQALTGDPGNQHSAGDLAAWQSNFGTSPDTNPGPPVSEVVGPSPDPDGHDFLTWQKGVGPSPATGPASVTPEEPALGGPDTQPEAHGDMVPTDQMSLNYSKFEHDVEGGPSAPGVADVQQKVMPEDEQAGDGSDEPGGTFGGPDTAPVEADQRYFVADSFSFGVEREMKESGEKGGTEEGPGLHQGTQDLMQSPDPPDAPGDVDGRDFLIWQKGDSPSPGGASDLADWQANYGAGANALPGLPMSPAYGGPDAAPEGQDSFLKWHEDFIVVGNNEPPGDGSVKPAEFQPGDALATDPGDDSSLNFQKEEIPLEHFSWGSSAPGAPDDAMQKVMPGDAAAGDGSVMPGDLQSEAEDTEDYLEVKLESAKVTSYQLGALDNDAAQGPEAGGQDLMQSPGLPDSPGGTEHQDDWSDAGAAAPSPDGTDGAKGGNVEFEWKVEEGESAMGAPGGKLYVGTDAGVFDEDETPTLGGLSTSDAMTPLGAGPIIGAEELPDLDEDLDTPEI